jgi:hypothetical protein
MLQIVALLMIVIDDTKANEGKSFARFCHQLAALFPDMFYNFFLVKNHKITKKKTPTTTKVREKNKHRFPILRIFMYVRLNLKTIKIT